jgi:hypothetical protein
MNEEQAEEPSPSERAGLAGLPRELLPPANLEDRVVRALAERGLLRSPWRRRRVFLLRAASGLAAGVLLFTGGWLTGRREVPRPSTTGGGRYMLLLREDAGFEVPPGGNAELVREYERWAVDLRRGGKLEGGEELGRGGWLLAGEGPPRDLSGMGTAPGRDAAQRIGGYFIIRAADAAQALGIARGCPHVRHGGRIELRPIQPT